MATHDINVPNVRLRSEPLLAEIAEYAERASHLDFTPWFVPLPVGHLQCAQEPSIRSKLNVEVDGHHA